MAIVPEGMVADMLTREAAFVAVEQVFAAMARGDARNFPVVREALGHEDTLYGFRAGLIRRAMCWASRPGATGPITLNGAT